MVKHQVSKYSSSHREHEIHIQGTPEDLRYDILRDKWYKLREVKKGQNKGKFRRAKFLGLIPVKIDDNIAKHLKGDYEFKIGIGDYLLDSTRGTWYTPRDSIGLSSIGTGNASRLNTALDTFVYESYNSNRDRLSPAITNNLEARDITKRLLHLDNGN